jgi:hypothetical protein
MQRFWLILAGVSAGWSADTGDWHEVLARVRENVAQQVSRSTNYTCIETVDRVVFESAHDLLAGCAYESPSIDRKKVTHDRLRLDVAVSEGNEIFAWHGEDKFAGSSMIDSVVRRGTTSSGEFIGFLNNIFVRGGIRFEYTGNAVTNGARTYLFDYRVPVTNSGYKVGTKRGKAAIPFHGSFSVRGTDFQLASLNVIADAIPESSMICSAETEMTYQIAKISGRDALVPSLFVLKLEDLNHRYTVSRSEYSGCRVFGAESTVRFDVDDGKAPTGTQQSGSEVQLPTGMSLRIALRSTIDDGSSYTGDRIEGVLLRAVKVKANGAATVIRKGAVVEGVITTLEERDWPEPYYLLGIEFERIRTGGTTFLFHATPVRSKLEAAKLTNIYRQGWPVEVQDIYRDGIFVLRSQHFHLGESFAGDWITGGPQAAAEMPAAVGRTMSPGHR